MPGERQLPCRGVHAEARDVVAALVAAVQESPRGVEAEAARIAAASPLLTDILQRAITTDGEDGDAVVQAVAGVDEPTVRRDQDLGAKVAPGEAARQCGDRLPGGERAGCGAQVEEDHVRALL